MQLTVGIAVFTDNYRSYISSLQIVAKRVHEQQGEITLHNIIHERYDFYTQ